MSKNNKATINTRTHNPFDVYQSTDHNISNSNNNNPNDNINEEFGPEFDSKAKNKNNSINHNKTQQTNKK